MKKMIANLFFVVVVVFMALFIGKTTYVDGKVYMQCPLAALFYILAVICSILNK